MLRKEFLGRGWKFPFQVDSSAGGVALSEYEQNIKECITIVLGTRPGERQMLPDFGCRIHEMMFSPNTTSTASIVAQHVKSALGKWERRIEVTKVKAWPDDSGTIRVLVNYRIKSTKELQEIDLVLASGG